MSTTEQSRRRTISHESFLRYRGFRWLWTGLLLSAVVAGCFSASFLLHDMHLKHTGSSWFGYTSGTIGAGLIVWLAALGIRKRVMTDNAWSLKAWVSAHVYLGLSLTVIATLHSGLQFGWNIHTLAYALMMLVILSGVFGIVMYARLPEKLSDSRGETTRKQMLEKINTLDGRLLDVARPLDQHQAALVRKAVQQTRIGGGFWQRLSGWHGNCPTRRAFQELSVARSHMVAGPQAAATDQVLSLLGEKNDTLHKARRYIRLRGLLEVWLYIHIPATLALIAALTAHIISVFFFW